MPSPRDSFYILPCLQLPVNTFFQIFFRFSILCWPLADDFDILSLLTRFCQHLFSQTFNFLRYCTAAYKTGILLHNTKGSLRFSYIYSFICISELKIITHSRTGTCRSNQICIAFQIRVRESFHFFRCPAFFTFCQFFFRYS